MESQQSNATISEPSGDFNFMRLRVETNDLLEELSQLLIGGRMHVFQDEKGNVQKKFIKTGTRLVNHIGHDYIMAGLRSIINPHTIQGNYITKNGVSKDYESDLYKWQIAVGNALISNKYIWEFDSRNHEFIVAHLRTMVGLILSRPLGNKEREGFNQTTKSVETSTTQQRGGFFGGRN